MSSSSSKSFFIKDILSKNCKSILSDEIDETEDNSLKKPIALRYYSNTIEHPLNPQLFPPNALLLSKSKNDIGHSSLNFLFEMHKRTLNKLHISRLDYDIAFKLSDKFFKRKRRKNRTAFTTYQIYVLEKRFTHQRYLTTHDRDQIAIELRLSAAQIITWFQNRRARLKRDYKELKNDVIIAKKVQTMKVPVGFI